MTRRDYIDCALKVETNRNKKLFCIEKVIETDECFFIDGTVGDIALKVNEVFTRYKNLGYYKTDNNKYHEQSMQIDVPVSIKIDTIYTTGLFTPPEIPAHSVTRLQVSGDDTKELMEGMILLVE